MGIQQQPFRKRLMCETTTWLLFIFVFMISTIRGQIRYSVPEEMKEGSLIGNVAQDLGLDLRRLRSGRARIVSGDTILLIKERIDREALCGQTTPYCESTLSEKSERTMKRQVLLFV
uniref:Cadherin N-terminal domain-containing protein n=1 Tax=Neolamprologus brichardi TaxID=32507 RepID=A0A3Q4GDT6_NEOBR